LGLYHKERQDKGEILDKNSLVFVKLNGKPVDKSSTSMIIHRALVRAGLKVKNNAKGNPKKQFIRHKIQLNHGFRKRFNTILKLNNDVNDNAIEKMMGHSNGLDSTYLQITDEKLFDEFWKGVDDLTVSGEYRDKLKIRELEKSIPNKEEVINKIIPLVMDKVRKEFAVNADEVDKMNSEQLKKLVKSFLAN
jgi:hypothetical protein